MVLIPRVRYERLLTALNEDKSKSKSEEEEDEAPAVQPATEKSTPKTGTPSPDKPLTTVSPEKTASVKSTDPATTDASTSADKDNKTLSKADVIGSGKSKMQMDNIVNEIPAQHKARAESILAYIRSKSDMGILSWNSRGRLVYKEEIVNGSNIAELIEYLISNKGKQPVSFKLFRKGLAKINMPTDLLKPHAVAKKYRKVDEGLSNKSLTKLWKSY